MSRISNILEHAKDTLAPNGRWEDARLIRLVDAAQKAICFRANILRGYSTIPLIMHQPYYSLPMLAHRITRVLYEGNLIPLVSHDAMDQTRGYGWERHVGKKVQALVYSLANTGDFRVYPTPSADSIQVDPLDGVTSDSEHYDMDSLFGVLVDVETDDSPVFTGDVLTVYYTMQPETVTSLDDSLALSPAFDAAIKYYVTGMALRDNQDTQSLQFAGSELQLFDSELRGILRDASLDNTSNAGAFSAPYTGGFNG